MMSVQFKKYRMLADFTRVLEFYRNNYKPGYWYISPPAFEYAHTHDLFNHVSAHRFGLWEETGQNEIVATVCYEMDLGECLICVKEGYEYLKNAILNYAEQELSRAIDGKHRLDVWLMDEKKIRS